jgi:hypothetical protein
MRRRLYFVLPDSRVTANIVDELRNVGIDSRYIAIASRNPAQVQIPDVHIQDATNDPGEQLERVVWNLNLAFFFIALLALLVMLATQGMTTWLAIPVAVMLACFTAGVRFTHVPNTHLREFGAALRHGELVLMVSVPRGRVAEIEDLVHSHHADAAVGGVGWSSELLHI